jgi:hypothetical protein
VLVRSGRGWSKAGGFLMLIDSNSKNKQICTKISELGLDKAKFSKKMHSILNITNSTCDRFRWEDVDGLFCHTLRATLDLLGKSILVQLEGPMRDTTMKLKTLNKVLNIYLKDNLFECNLFLS